jgi:hypothetical protein
MSSRTPRTVRTAPHRAEARERYGPKRSQALSSLSAELENVRLQLRETLQHFSLREESQLLEWIRVLDGHGGESVAAPSAKTALALRKRLRRLRLKPHKGRLKDLAAAHDALKAIARRLPPAV